MKFKNKINATARSIYTWQGFKLQKGCIYGTIIIKNIPYRFVYFGKHRRKVRPDGTLGSREMCLFLLDLPVNDPENDHNLFWEKTWIDVYKGSFQEKILNTNPKVEFYVEPVETAPRNILAYVPRQKNIGFIYSMVRERQ